MIPTRPRTDVIVGGRRGTATALNDEHSRIRIEADGLPTAHVEPLGDLHQKDLIALVRGYLEGHCGPGVLWAWSPASAVAS